MGNDAVSHRVAIGIFYCKTNPCTHKCSFHRTHVIVEILELFLFTCCYVKKRCYDFCTNNLTNFALVISIVKLLMLLSGDIEENPGPPQGDITRFLQTSVSIIHLNIRSLRNKISDIAHIVEDFDIVCFTESHLDLNVLVKSSQSFI